MFARKDLFALVVCLLVGCDANTQELGPVKVDPNAPPVKPMMGGGAPMSEEAKAKMAEGYQKYAPPHEQERMAREKAASEAEAKQAAGAEQPEATGTEATGTEAQPTATPTETTAPEGKSDN